MFIVPSILQKSDVTETFWLFHPSCQTTYSEFPIILCVSSPTEICSKTNYGIISSGIDSQAFVFLSVFERMATNEQARAPSGQLVVFGQSDSEDAVSVVYDDSCDEDEPAMDAMHEDLCERKLELKKIRDNNRSLMQLTSGPDGSDLVDIQRRFHSSIYYCTKKLWHALHMLRRVEMLGQTLIETEALVRGLESKTDGKVQYDKKKLSGERFLLSHQHLYFKFNLDNVCKEEELETVIDEMRNLRSIPGNQ